MKIKEFLQDNILEAVEIVDNIIINLVCEETCYGIDVNTANIMAGTLTVRREDFVLIDDILSIDNISINIDTTNMLG